MKTISGFILVMVAAACAACATQRTLPSHPVVQSGGYIPGYQHVLVDGQDRYCYAKGSGTERKAICLTDAAVWEARNRREQMVENGTRPPTPNLDSQQVGVQLLQSAANMPGQYTGQR